MIAIFSSVLDDHLVPSFEPMHSEKLTDPGTLTKYFLISGNISLDRPVNSAVHF